eukprot:m.395848 g.395848  ORF g.395848 m.395848 type:complete len:89 (-) comp28353_c1_seq11:1662-1928(-)
MAGCCGKCRHRVFQLGLLLVAATAALVVAACIEYSLGDAEANKDRIYFSGSCLSLALGLVAAAMGPPCDPAAQKRAMRGDLPPGLKSE